MKDSAEHILLTTLAAYGLLKLLEELFPPRRARVVVVAATPETLAEVLEQGEDDQE